MTTPVPSPGHRPALSHIDEAHRDRLAAMGVLAASIAHEINNILTPVLCYAQMAQRDPDDDLIVKRAIDAAAAGAERAHSIANVILRLSKPGSPATRDPTPVADAVQSALGMVKGDIERLCIDVKQSVAPSLEAVVDPVCLEQVLVNLLSNAVRAAGPGGQVVVEAECSVRNGAECSMRNDVLIRIRDSGHGMDQAALANAFEPFPSRSPESHGLGLSICKRLIESAGGTVRADSTPATGTTVTLQLPLAA